MKCYLNRKELLGWGRFLSKLLDFLTFLSDFEKITLVLHFQLFKSGKHWYVDQTIIQETFINEQTLIFLAAMNYFFIEGSRMSIF